MKFAIISDIHGNLEALKAVLERAEYEGATKFVCAGDIVGYNANPAECLEIVRNLDIVAIVRGNHDEYVGNDYDLEGFNPGAKHAVMWTRGQLSSEQREWLRKPKLKEIVSKANITVVHATLDSPSSWGYIQDIYHARDNFSYQMTQYCFCGHSHVPVLFRKGISMETKSVGVTELTEWNELSKYEDEITVDADFGCKYLVNIGSIGQPRNGDNRASFVIYDSDKRSIKRICIDYDIETVQEKVRKAGLPEKLALRLEIGR